jgi:hypothetical protein
LPHTSDYRSFYYENRSLGPWKAKRRLEARNKEAKMELARCPETPS